MQLSRLRLPTHSLVDEQKSVASELQNLLRTQLQARMHCECRFRQRVARMCVSSRHINRERAQVCTRVDGCRLRGCGSGWRGRSRGAGGNESAVPATRAVAAGGTACAIPCKHANGVTAAECTADDGAQHDGRAGELRASDRVERRVDCGQFDACSWSRPRPALAQARHCRAFVEDCAM